MVVNIERFIENIQVAVVLDHVAEWVIWIIEQRLEQVRHHHVIFTIPKMLRVYFRYNRTLLNDLSRVANQAVLTYCRHLKWQPGKPLVSCVRPPPEMLKVAESLPEHLNPRTGFSLDQTPLGGGVAEFRC